MGFSNLKLIFEDFLGANNQDEKNNVIQLLIEEIFKNGFDTNAIEYFSMQFNTSKKQDLVSVIFTHLIQPDLAKKTQIIDVLSSFLVETTLLIQDQILPIYFKTLRDKTNFDLVFTTIKIFNSKWNDFPDDLKKTIFREYLTILDSAFDMFIEEGAFEITKIFLSSKNSRDNSLNLFNDDEAREFLKKLLKLALKVKSDPLYACLESLKQILDKYPKLISKETFDLLNPLFKKITKKIAFFYPAKRQFVKNALSFLNLTLIFEKEFSNEEYNINLKLLLEKIVLKVDHPEIKYFLELILVILKNSTNISKIDVLKPSFPVLRDLYQKKNRIDESITELVEEIINLLWPIITDEDKDLFFQEIEFGENIM